MIQLKVMAALLAAATAGCKSFTDAATDRKQAAGKETAAVSQVLDGKLAQFSLTLPTVPGDVSSQSSSGDQALDVDEASSSESGASQEEIDADKKLAVKVTYRDGRPMVEKTVSIGEERALLSDLPLGVVKVEIELLDQEGSVLRAGESQWMRLVPGTNRLAIRLKPIDLTSQPVSSDDDADLSIVLRDAEDLRDERLRRARYADARNLQVRADLGDVRRRYRAEQLDQLRMCRNESAAPAPCPFTRVRLDRASRLEAKAMLIRYFAENGSVKPFIFAAYKTSEFMVFRVAFRRGGFDVVGSNFDFSNPFDYFGKMSPSVDDQDSMPVDSDASNPVDGSDSDESGLAEGEVEEAIETDLDAILDDSEQPGEDIAQPGDDSVDGTVDQSPSDGDVSDALSIEEMRTRLRSGLAGLLNDVKKVSYQLESNTFSDGCLGLAQDGEMCSSQLVEGFIITIALGEGENRRVVVAHASRDLTNIRLRS